MKKPYCFFRVLKRVKNGLKWLKMSKNICQEPNRGKSWRCQCGQAGETKLSFLSRLAMSGLSRNVCISHWGYMRDAWNYTFDMNYLHENMSPSAISEYSDTLLELLDVLPDQMIRYWHVTTSASPNQKWPNSGTDFWLNMVHTVSIGLITHLIFVSNTSSGVGLLF